jgi:hypothetical protein
MMTVGCLMGRPLVLATRFGRGAVAQNLELAVLDQPLQGFVIHVLVCDLPGFAGAEVKGLPPRQGNSKGSICFILNGLHEQTSHSSDNPIFSNF